VRDTGVGIAAGKQALIFEAFQQADGSTTRKFGGTGLGLAVSAQLVNLMGGKIGVKSVLGEGSIFHFTVQFDVDPTRPAGIELPAEIDLSRRRVLVVDDNDTNLKILCEMLTSWKMMPQAAASAAAARKALAASTKRKRPFDLALIDSDLPEDGALSLFRQLKAMTGEATRTLFMVTSLTDHRTVRLGQRRGAINLAKPIRPSDLLDAVIRSLGIDVDPYESLGPDTTVGHLFPLSALHILVAEDTPFNQKYIRRLLDSWGCRSSLVNTGRQAIEALTRQAFDLVLMDVQMPEMDGLTATTRIREMERETGRHVPIIAMTAHAMKGDRERCLDAGMDDYVSKPISSTTLLDAIYRVVPAPSAPDAADRHTEPPEAAEGGGDMAALLDAFNGDAAFFKDVADMFISDYPPMIDAVEQAIREEDGERLSRTAHALKGMARNFQVDDAAAAAQQLEQAASDKQFDTAAGLCRQMAAALNVFEQRLVRMMARM
jgi:CheY-like chemotaxis protein/HPt (histidine-containing phosphotransfer) domain-containing protein